jgi:hypothetical protein
MQQSERTQSVILMGRPACPKCATRMMLARITPEKPDHDRRTFECPGCDHALDEIVRFR